MPDRGNLNFFFKRTWWWDSSSEDFVAISTKVKVIIKLENYLDLTTFHEDQNKICAICTKKIKDLLRKFVNLRVRATWNANISKKKSEDSENYSD